MAAGHGLALSLVQPTADRWLALFRLCGPWLGLLTPPAGPPAPAWSGLWHGPLHGLAWLVTLELAWRLR